MLALLASQDEDGNPVAIRVRGDYPAGICFSLKDLGDMASRFPKKQEETAANRRAFFDLVGLNIRKQVRLTPQHQSIESNTVCYEKLLINHSSASASGWNLRWVS